jgi:tol-pal system protein YbgF
MEQALLIKNKLKSIAVAASLLFSGVMLLSSCAAVPKANVPKASQPNLEQTVKTVEKLQTKLTDLDRRIAELEYLETRVKALERPVKSKTNTAKSTLKQDFEPVYTNPILLYNRARSLLLEENFKGASELFKEYVKQFPDSELADNALYWLGECHYSLGEYQDAIKTFKDVVTLYPNRGKSPDALLKTAYAYLMLDDADRAHHYLKLVVKGYPFTQAGEKAEQKLKAFQ